jgi:uncharacterized membrane protein
MSKNNKNETSYLAIGTGLGVMFGILFKNLALGIALGVGIGVALDAKNNKNKSDKQG